jgi:hypothetical protein
MALPATHHPIVERHGSGPDDAGAIAHAELELDPYPTYRELRERGVVWVDALQRWMVTRWDDVIRVETGRQHFSSDETDSNLTRIVGPQMLRSDGAAHKRLRGAAQDPLRPDAAAGLADSLRALADELIDGVVDRGGTDLVSSFAAPFAALSLAKVIGLANASAGDIERWSRAVLDGSSNYADNPDTWACTRATMPEIDAAVQTAVDHPPPGSIIEAMCAADGAGAPLSIEEITANVKVIIGGGFNEPRDAISTTLWGMLNHPDQLAAVRDDAALLAAAVEESLRWVSPIGVAPREVISPLRLADTDLEPGARLLINFASANRDERHWERPDAFDISRPKTRHLAFGMGHHFCLGVWLSRTQVTTVALPRLLSRLPGLALNLDRPPAIRGWVFRGPNDLHLTWNA